MINKLKKLRLIAGLTQNYISHKVGLHPRNYQKIEQGKHLPRVDRALTLAKALNTTVEELFSNDKLQ